MDHPDLVQVIGLTRATKNAQARRRVICYFDLELAGILRIYGAGLVRTENDGVSVFMPKLDTDNRRRVEIVDQALLSAVGAKAIKAYRTLGGTDAPDWAGRSKAHQEDAA